MMESPQWYRKLGIPKDTLYSWRNKVRKGKVSKQSTNNGQLNSEEKFNAVMETAAMNEVELGKYYRSKGIFPLQINAWRKTCTGSVE